MERGRGVEREEEAGTRWTGMTTSGREACHPSGAGEEDGVEEDEVGDVAEGDEAEEAGVEAGAEDEEGGSR